jgi:hypothetical protein
MYRYCRYRTVVYHVSWIVKLLHAFAFALDRRSHRRIGYSSRSLRTKNCITACRFNLTEHTQVTFKTRRMTSTAKKVFMTFIPFARAAIKPHTAHLYQARARAHYQKKQSSHFSSSPFLKRVSCLPSQKACPPKSFL